MERKSRLTGVCCSTVGPVSAFVVVALPKCPICLFLLFGAMGAWVVPVCMPAIAVAAIYCFYLTRKRTRLIRGKGFPVHFVAGLLLSLSFLYGLLGKL